MAGHVPGNIAGSPLGSSVAYRDTYAPELLFPVSRAPQRQDIGIAGALPFHGVDVWNAYELSWLNARGKPVAATARFEVPAASPNIVESKSLKLYLNSLNQTRFADLGQVRETLARDLSAAAGASVGVTVETMGSGAARHVRNFAGVLLDELDVDVAHYEPAPHLLALAGDQVVEEVLVSHLLKSNCPVTGQPDWATVRIAYRGSAIDHGGLLAYIVSFRRHSGFHEHCVERIYSDLRARCAPQRLSVYARYTRRGGLDINPFRSSEAGDAPENDGDIRQ